jgi:hypothetical protein
MQEHAVRYVTEAIAIVLMYAFGLPTMERISVLPSPQCKVSLKSVNWTDTGRVFKSQVPGDFFKKN